MTRAELHYLNCQNTNCDKIACVGRRDYEGRISKLEYVITEIQWMARRYAHGRMTYSVSMYNDAIKLAQSTGMTFRPDPIDGLVEAKDGMFDKEWFEQNPDKR